MSKKSDFVKGNFLRALSKTDLPPDFVIGMPVIRMAFNREMFIEDVGFLEHYDRESIKLYQKKLCISIFGKELEIKFLADNNIRIVGTITSINFENGGKENDGA